MAWEAGEQFPTKKHCQSLRALKEKGPSAVPRRTRADRKGPYQVLEDPGFWAVVRKLLAHRQLRDEVLRIAAAYSDPEDD